MIDTKGKARENMQLRRQQGRGTEEVRLRRAWRLSERAVGSEGYRYPTESTQDQ